MTKKKHMKTVQVKSGRVTQATMHRADWVRLGDMRQLVEAADSLGMSNDSVLLGLNGPVRDRLGFNDYHLED